MKPLELGGKQLASAAWRFQRKKMHIAVQKRTDVFGRRRNFMLVEYAGDDARIGHTRDFDAVQVIGNAEPLSKRGFERVHAGAAGMDERAIDIEKKEPPLHFCHVEWGRDI